MSRSISDHSCAPQKELTSLILVCYNQEKYIEASLKSALKQNYSPLQIVISDDCSSDRTFEIIQSIAKGYRGPHSLVLNQTNQNSGLATNLNQAWKKCDGDFIVVQAGDDLSEPNRVTRLVEARGNGPKKADLVFSNVTRIDENGEVVSVEKGLRNPPDLDEYLGMKLYTAGGMAAGYSKDLMAKHGWLDAEIVAEDFALTFRAVAGNGVIHIADPLVRYRIHSKSIMGGWRKENLYNRKDNAALAKRLIALQEDHLRVLHSLKKWYPRATFTWKRKLTALKISLLSSSTHFRTLSFVLFLYCVLTARPKLARELLFRDVLRLKNIE